MKPWAIQCLAPWSVGAFLLVSFTASAGPRDSWLDRNHYRISMLGNVSFDSALPLAVPARIRAQIADDTTQAAASSWLVQPSLTADDTASASPLELIFLDSIDLLIASQLVPPDSSTPLPALPGKRFTATGWDGATSASDFGYVVPGSLNGSTSPRALALLTAQLPDGATPEISRAISLSSTTPAPVEPQIVTGQPVATVPVVAMVETRHVDKAAVAPQPNHPNYADLIDPEDMSREQRCLAEAIYFEARSESASGQAAVAQVVLNRVRSGVYPDSVCGVVYQNRSHYKACQFSFACEGKSLRITEPAPWKQAVKIARDVTFGQTYLTKVGNATHYHADYVRPVWSRRFKKNDVIGRHIFYRPKPGQT